jgi:hypothetical protein
MAQAAQMPNGWILFLPSAPERFYAGVGDPLADVGLKQALLNQAINVAMSVFGAEGEGVASAASELSGAELRMALRSRALAAESAVSAESVGDFALNLGGACFVAGTLVHTERGLLPIEHVRVGEMVLAQPEGSGERAFRRVTDTVSSDDKVVLEVVFETADGTQETALTTPGHPFWVQVLGWRALAALEPGHKLQLRNGGEATVLSVRDVGAPQRVFTLTLDGFHTYYVGRSGVWVHNASSISDIRSLSAADLAKGPEATYELAMQIQGNVPLDAQTINILETTGPTIVTANSGRPLTDLQIATARELGMLPGVDLGGETHAELNGLFTAGELYNRGVVPIRGVTTNAVCPGCEEELVNQASRGGYQTAFTASKRAYSFQRMAP